MSFAKGLLSWAAVNGFAATALAAIGSHQPTVAGNPVLAAVFATANRFHFYHSLALLALGLWLLLATGKNRWLPAAAGLLSLGLVLFCTTLYVYAFSGVKWLGALTPVGGSCLMLGWLCLAVAPWRSR